MRSRLVCFLLLSIITVTATAQRKRILLDSDWKFHRGGAQSAEQPTYDDSSWRDLNLPHDWSVEDLPGTESPFSRDAISQVNGGFTTGGTGWYRKSFNLSPDDKGKRVIILFEGIYMNSEVWINGESLGSHPYGYSSFWFDITNRIKYDGPNLLAVKVRNEGENSRWYTGSGIYRHVWLTVTDPVSIAQWGTAVTTPAVSRNSATVKVNVTTNNKTDKEAFIRLVTHIIDKSGKEVSVSSAEKTVNPLSSFDFEMDMKVSDPELWSCDSPYMYKAVSEVYSSGRLTDIYETPFGIRSISFDPVKGFTLNGKPMKLKGGCLHHDNGPLGSAAYDRAEERRVELLKASGFNALRCSHNPPSPAFLDACDRLGMLVIDEAFDMWQYPKNPADYNLYFTNWWQKDIESMIFRDRNHPSVILWSIGNEIPGMDSPEVVRTAGMLAGHVRKCDPTRPVTVAVNNLNPKKDPYFAMVDIAGYNYGSGGDHQKETIFSIDHDRVPARIMIQTESYPLEAFKSWMDVIDNSYLLGDFVWTAFDYIGEASIGWRGYWQKQDFFPWNLAFCGDLDICGWKRPQSYYRDALWKEGQLSIFVKPPEPSFPENRDRMSWSKWHWDDAVADWNWVGKEGKPLEVTVYSSCEEVELILNNKSFGRKKTGRAEEFRAAWTIPYQPGELKAVGYTAGKQKNGAILRTTGEAKQIKLSADRTTIVAGGQDLSYVTVELTDQNGLRNPKAENLLKFEIEGPGTIVAVGNGNPVSLESYQSDSRRAWQGRCLVIIRSESTRGSILLKAASPGLKTSEIIITAKNTQD